MYFCVVSEIVSSIVSSIVLSIVLGDRIRSRRIATIITQSAVLFTFSRVDGRSGLNVNNRADWSLFFV